MLNIYLCLAIAFQNPRAPNSSIHERQGPKMPCFWDGGLIQPLRSCLLWVRSGQLLAFKEDVVELFKAHHLVPVQIGLRFEDIFYSRSQLRKVAFTSIIISISSWQEKWTPILNEWQIGETRIGSAQRQAVLYPTLTDQSVSLCRSSYISGIFWCLLFWVCFFYLLRTNFNSEEVIKPLPSWNITPETTPQPPTS